MSKNKEWIYKERQIENMEDKKLKIGDGKISGYISVFLGIFSFLAVLAYLFPSYLTTQMLRNSYDAKELQVVLMYGMYTSLFFGLITFVLNKRKRLGAIGVLFTALAFALGGYNVPVGDVVNSNYSLGIDWLILDFLASSILFMFLEKIIPKYKDQVIFRPEWKLDFSYFCMNHLLITVLLLVSNHFASSVFDFAINAKFQEWIQSLHIGVQVLILIICADFVLYWSHRLFHEIPFMWKFHTIHHSTEHMDWMAGSRTHIVNTIIDRSLVLVPLYLLGTSKESLDIYVVFAALQAVWVHSNTNIPTGFLKYFIVTPQFHHWHHSSERPAWDTNYSAHTPLFDVIFKSYHMPNNHWPVKYGTTDKVPRSFIKQFLYPMKKKK
jgi:sterol desaturase/sphingolipid hydroxylase (fatty acid hydroxylase superfamily)